MAATDTPVPGDGGDLTRRSVLQRTAAIGLLAAPAAGLLGACATSGGDDDTEDVTNTGDAENPFGVDPKAPLEVVIFDGGFGNAYAKDGHEPMYKAKFPDAEITHTATVQISETQKPRFAEGKPADVLNNSGAQKIPFDVLVNDGEAAELTPLLDAPSVDDPNVKVRDTLRPGVVESGTYNGKVYFLNYVFGVWAIWYDAALFREKNWAVPTTWDEMMALCETIKADGIAPWTYAGKHPGYLADALITLAVRHGGLQVSRDIDELKAGAWQHPSMVAATEALYSLYEKGYILDGTPGIDHIQSQTAWNNHEAAFIPCGVWLPNEQKDSTPAGFEYSLIGVPPLAGSADPTIVRGGGSESFMVAEKAANKSGGYEYLRIMLSKEGAKKFSDSTHTATSVVGVSIEDSAAKATDALVSSASTVYQSKLTEWYTVLKETLDPALGALMSGESDPAKFRETMQTAADEVAADDGIEKFHW